MSRDVTVLTPITSEAVPVAWDQATTVGFTSSELTSAPEDDAGVADHPAAAGRKKSYHG